MINVKVTGIQQVQEALKKEIKKISTGKTVLTGIHEGAGSTDDGGITMAGLGATLHFGAEINHPGGTSYGYRTQKDMVNGRISFLSKGKGYAVVGVTKAHKITIPARPWLDVGVATGVPEYLEVIKNHKNDMDLALEIIGQISVSKVQQYMTQLKTPPNAQSTIDKKGSSNPLIDTGELRQSVTYTISDVKPSEGLK